MSKRFRSARVVSLSLLGLDADPIQIEVRLGDGSAGLHLVGPSEASAREARVRVRAALQQLGIDIQDQGVVVTIEPKDLAHGGAFDLAIAVATLITLGHLPAEPVRDVALLGELSLTGSIRSVRGALPRLQRAAGLGISCAIVPHDNAREAALVEGLQIFQADHLGAVVEHLQGVKLLAGIAAPQATAPAASPRDVSELRGLEGVPRVLEIAAAGGHDLLLVGSPGTAKHALVRRLPGILPPMSREEALEVTAIHSIAGLLPPDQGLIATRPCRAPHHTVSAAGLLGGGDPVRPGEVSLAHHGVLLLDELTEFRRANLEALHQTLDREQAVLVRARQRVTFPAKPMLVGAVPPCSCGFAGTSRCICSPERIAVYQERLTGPFFERFDLRIVVPQVDLTKPHASSKFETSQSVQGRVVRARTRQQERARQVNGRLSAEELGRLVKPDEAGAKVLAQATERLGLLAAEHARVLRMARTIADLAGSETVLPPHVAEALRLGVHDQAELRKCPR